MENEVLLWFLLTLFWTCIMSFYSTQEMACISFNRVRLDYIVAKKKRWGMLLKKLLETPTRLFTTTLIGVNIGLIASSECSRRFYTAAHINPNYAPFFEIPFVLIFGELVPMFAARIYAEHAARLGTPLLYLSAKFFTPVIAIVEWFFSCMRHFFQKKEPEEAHAIMNREELQKLFEEHDTARSHEEKQYTDVANVIALTNKKANQLMISLHEFPLFPSHATVKDVCYKLKTSPFSIVLLYSKTEKKIIGIVPVKALLQANDHKRIREFARSPCFVSEYTEVVDLLLQLQNEKEACAIVLDIHGVPQGVITLQSVLQELFDEAPSFLASPAPLKLYLEKTIPADTRIIDFMEAFGLSFDTQGCSTFAELTEKILGRKPTIGDLIIIDPIEVIIKDTSLLRAKTVLIRSHAR